ncbi:MAG: hypothetical protein GX556_00515 [Fibrobacter sp.]|nr:hypothetical protein [Fibrobacter sp.]
MINLFSNTATDVMPLKNGIHLRIDENGLFNCRFQTEIVVSTWFNHYFKFRSKKDHNIVSSAVKYLSINGIDQILTVN